MVGPLEKALFRLTGIKKEVEYDWKGYTLRFLALDFVMILFSYIVLRMQGHLPLNPAQVPGMRPDLAFNTAISFGTNTNWQAYAGETQASYLSQMIVMTVCMFTSAASGLVVAIAFMRGLSRKGTPHRQFLCRFHPGHPAHPPALAVVGAIILVPPGVIQTMKGPVQATTLEGAEQVIPGDRWPPGVHQAHRQQRGRLLQRQRSHPSRTPARSPILLIYC